MQWIEKCLNSLLGSSYPVHVVVIDNGSKDETLPFIGHHFPQVQLIETGKNLGFGQANNIGLALAIKNNADHVFLLNQDAYVEPDTISSLIRVQNENPGFGILSPLHFNGQGSALDAYFLNYLIESDKHALEQIKDHSLISTRFVNAAAWLMTTACIRQTGGFDPIFFHYGEDQNYARRALFHGFKIGIYTGARIYHDREQRIAKPDSAEAIRKKDWIHFLNQACDINKPQYMPLIARRLLRYSVQLVPALLSFNKTRIAYNFFMARKIAASIPQIAKSRKISLTAGMPHLQPDPKW